MPDEPDPSANRVTDSDTQSSPRAFANTTGVVYQIAGMGYFLGGGGYWFISGRVQGRSAVRVETLGDDLDEANILLSITTANVLAAVVGGLAMMALGVGLLGDRRRSATGAMIASGLLAVINLAGAVLYVVFGPAWLRMVVVAFLGACNTVLFLLAGHSAAVLREHPPPADQGVVDGAWLEAFERDRAARRRRN